VSTPERPDPARAWRYVENLLAEEELERLDKLGDRELGVEMQAAEIDPARVPSAEQLLTRAEERARLRPLGRAGTQGAKVPALPERTRRAPGLLWLVAAALGAAIVALGIERREVVAWLRHDTLAIGPDRWSPDRAPTPRERAAKLRDEAVAACGAALWGTCEQRLDEARTLDPAGEGEARVRRRAVRSRIRSGPMRGGPRSRAGSEGSPGILM
jgi:hypothetical protein